jgi:alpha-beta hydrolase superfamily lysophospholipase
MIELPLLVLQGGADRLVSPQGTERFFSLLGSSDKTLKAYEGLYHEIYNEPEFREVLADVESWLRERLSLAHAVRSA